MILKNDTNRYHLYYLFLNDFRNDKYDGLSHVAEHAFLVLRDINFAKAKIKNKYTRVISILRTTR